MSEKITAIILNAKSTGASGFLVTLFSQSHGRIKGMVKGGSKKAVDLQIGNFVEVERFRRLENQLGTFKLECLQNISSKLFDSYLGLQILTTVSEVLDKTLHEEEIHEELYQVTKTFFQKLVELADCNSNKNIPNLETATPHLMRGLPSLHNNKERNNSHLLWEELAFYELKLLAGIGYGLSLSESSAVREGDDDTSPLKYVSPKSGRAVSQRAGSAYHNKLLILPEIFGGEEVDGGNIAKAFELTGVFLDKALQGKTLEGREQLILYGIERNFS